MSFEDDMETTGTGTTGTEVPFSSVADLEGADDFLAPQQPITFGEIGAPLTDDAGTGVAQDSGVTAAGLTPPTFLLSSSDDAGALETSPERSSTTTTPVWTSEQSPLAPASAATSTAAIAAAAPAPVQWTPPQQQQQQQQSEQSRCKHCQQRFEDMVLNDTGRCREGAARWDRNWRESGTPCFGVCGCSEFCVDHGYPLGTCRERIPGAKHLTFVYRGTWTQCRRKRGATSAEDDPEEHPTTTTTAAAAAPAQKEEAPLLKKRQKRSPEEEEPHVLPDQQSFDVLLPQAPIPPDLLQSDPLSLAAETSAAAAVVAVSPKSEFALCQPSLQQKECPSSMECMRRLRKLLGADWIKLDPVAVDAITKLEAASALGCCQGFCTATHCCRIHWAPADIRKPQGGGSKYHCRWNPAEHAGRKGHHHADFAFYCSDPVCCAGKWFSRDETHKRGRAAATGSKRLTGEQQKTVFREGASPELAKGKSPDVAVAVVPDTPPPYSSSPRAVARKGVEDAAGTPVASAPAITDMVESIEEEQTPGEELEVHQSEDAGHGESIPLVRSAKAPANALKEEYVKRSWLWHMVNGRLSVPRIVFILMGVLTVSTLCAMIAVIIRTTSFTPIAQRWTGGFTANWTGLESGRTTAFMTCNFITATSAISCSDKYFSALIQTEDGHTAISYNVTTAWSTSVVSLTNSVPFPISISGGGSREGKTSDKWTLIIGKL